MIEAEQLLAGNVVTVNHSLSATSPSLHLYSIVYTDVCTPVCVCEKEEGEGKGFLNTNTANDQL